MVKVGVRNSSFFRNNLLADSKPKLDVQPLPHGAVTHIHTYAYMCNKYDNNAPKDNALYFLSA